MQTSEELRAHLQHGAHEIRQIKQLLATALDRAQTTSDEIHMCSDCVKLIDPTIDALNHEVHRLTAEMDRVYALRDDDGTDNGTDAYLRRLNAQLRIDLAALQKALQREKEQHQANLTTAVECNKELKQRVLSLERFNDLLKAKINEMREKYEDAIIEVTDLKDANRTLQSTPGEYRKGNNLSLHSAYDLQLSTSFRTLQPSAMQTVARLRDQPHLARQ